MITRKIGMNRGKRRIWLEGAVLSDNDINHGMRFDVLNHDNVLEIRVGPEGKRKIAGKPGRPIIDMSGATITDSFADSVTVVQVTHTTPGLVLTGIK